MKVCIFLGPTLDAAAARRELDAVILPPAAQGDVYRAAQARPLAIGIVDGYFEHVPSVWHKEILWAMSRGIHVYGAASIGALRAAELSSFGMEGVGAVYEAFARGDLEDDDEVAVAHALAEDGYRPLSEPMVDIRSTLARARAEGVIGEATERALVQVGKTLFYADRSYRAVLAGGEALGLPEGQLAGLRAFLAAGRVFQKRQDALAMLRLMRARLAEEPGPKRVRYTFAHTDAWERVRLEALGPPRADERAGEACH